MMNYILMATMNYILMATLAQRINDELYLDGNARQNLATFCQNLGPLSARPGTTIMSIS